jgi:hypothetical protein
MNPRQLKEAVLRSMSLEEIENLKLEAMQRGGKMTNEDIERMAGFSASQI